MEKAISLVEARQQFETIVREVQGNGDHFVVNSHGEPVAVVIPVELYRQWKRDRAAFFERWEAIAARANVPDDEALILAEEAVLAARATRD